MSSMVMYLLFALMHGPNDSATLTQLASFNDKASCETAAGKIKTALSKGADVAVDLACISTEQLRALRN